MAVLWMQFCVQMCATVQPLCSCILDLLCRQKWGSDSASLVSTACDLLDSLACITPPHVSTDCSSTARGSCPAPQLAHSLHQLLPSKRPGLVLHSPHHRVLSAALKAICVLLLPPSYAYGSGGFECRSHDCIAGQVRCSPEFADKILIATHCSRS